MMISQRRVKQLVAPLLPEALKAPLRGRLFGFRPASVHLPVTFDGDVARIDGRVGLRFREEDRVDLAYHLVENGESLEELSSFLQVTAGARLFFDVGAARGLFSHVFCLGGSDRRAIAFEPSPLLSAAGRALAGLNRIDSQIDWKECAVGAQPGTANATIDPAGFMSMAAAPAPGGIGVAVTSLDAEATRLARMPDVIKIDVEGFEDEVLIGARELLNARKPTLCIELHLDLLERRGVSPATVVGRLVSHGYRFRTCAGASVRAAQIAGSMKALYRFVAY